MRKIVLSVLGLIVLTLVIYRLTLFFQSETPHFFRGDDSRLRYVGRFDFSEGNTPKSWAPGSYMECELYGKEAELFLNDEQRFGFLHNYIEIVIDHKYTKRIQLSEKVNIISLFKFSKPGKHHVLICKNTESSIGFIEFLGIKCAKLLPIKTKKKRLFEFIGDSITCGNGSDSSSITFGKGSWYDYHNAYLSYGARLARKNHADWILSAVSGIGMQHSCCGMFFTMPDVYTKINFHVKSKSWSFDKAPIPDIVFITLGQNDSAKQMEEYEKAYLSFLQKLRKVYPKSWIICCTSPMAKPEYKEKLKNSIQKVLQLRRKAGDQRLLFFNYQNTYNAGYDQHPTISQHEEMMWEAQRFLDSKWTLLNH